MMNLFDSHSDFVLVFMDLPLSSALIMDIAFARASDASSLSWSSDKAFSLDLPLSDESDSK